MAAFNWIVAQSKCPVCGATATIRAQTHVASSYSGDETGRFYDRVYRLGDRMAWWPESDPRFPEWREDGEPNQPSDQAVEACYAFCERCQGELYMIVRFSSLRVAQVLGIGRQSEWPKEYRR